MTTEDDAARDAGDITVSGEPADALSLAKGLQEAPNPVLQSAGRILEAILEPAEAALLAETERFEAESDEDGDDQTRSAVAACNAMSAMIAAVSVVMAARLNGGWDLECEDGATLARYFGAHLTATFGVSIHTWIQCPAPAWLKAIEDAATDPDAEEGWRSAFAELAEGGETPGLFGDPDTFARIAGVVQPIARRRIEAHEAAGEDPQDAFATAWGEVAVALGGIIAAWARDSEDQWPGGNALLATQLARAMVLPLYVGMGLDPPDWAGPDKPVGDGDVMASAGAYSARSYATEGPGTLRRALSQVTVEAMARGDAYEDILSALASQLASMAANISPKPARRATVKQMVRDLPVRIESFRSKINRESERMAKIDQGIGTGGTA